MSWLAAIVKALLQGALDFLGQRLDRKNGDDVLREAGARQVESKQHEDWKAASREAMDLRARPAGSDAELDDSLRAPGDRAARRAE